MLLENEQLPARLLATIQSLIRDDSRLSEMKKAMLALSRPDAASKIAAALSNLAAKTSRSSGGAA
jgi:UDP-N-acetylglucosamine:LPS N-acetylglucosamine transferase